jgi:hypothetical protein
MQELQHLERHGISITLANRQRIRVYATLLFDCNDTAGHAKWNGGGGHQAHEGACHRCNIRGVKVPGARKGKRTVFPGSIGMVSSSAEHTEDIRDEWRHTFSTSSIAGTSIVAHDAIIHPDSDMKRAGQGAAAAALYGLPSLPPLQPGVVVAGGRTMFNGVARPLQGWAAVDDVAAAIAIEPSYDGTEPITTFGYIGDDEHGRDDDAAHRQLPPAGSEHDGWESPIADYIEWDSIDQHLIDPMHGVGNIGKLITTILQSTPTPGALQHELSRRTIRGLFKLGTKKVGATIVPYITREEKKHTDEKGDYADGDDHSDDSQLQDDDAYNNSDDPDSALLVIEQPKRAAGAWAPIATSNKKKRKKRSINQKKAIKAARFTKDGHEAEANKEKKKKEKEEKECDKEVRCYWLTKGNQRAVDERSKGLRLTVPGGGHIRALFQYTSFLKSYDWSLFMSDVGIYLIYDVLTDIIPCEVRDGIIRVMRWVREINGKTIRRDQLKWLENEGHHALITLEMIMPDQVNMISKHAMHHWARMIRLVGPLWCVHMFPLERLNGSMIKSLRGYSHPYIELARQLLLREQLSMYNWSTSHSHMDDWLPTAAKKHRSATNIYINEPSWHTHQYEQQPAGKARLYTLSLECRCDMYKWFHHRFHIYSPWSHWWREYNQIKRPPLIFPEWLHKKADEHVHARQVREGKEQRHDDNKDAQILLVNDITINSLLDVRLQVKASRYAAIRIGTHMFRTVLFKRKKKRLPDENDDYDDEDSKHVYDGSSYDSKSTISYDMNGSTHIGRLIRVIRYLPMDHDDLVQLRASANGRIIAANPSCTTHQLMCYVQCAKSYARAITPLPIYAFPHIGTSDDVMFHWIPATAIQPRHITLARVLHPTHTQHLVDTHASDPTKEAAFYILKY